MGETTVPPRTIFCTPSISTDTWVLVALFPDNQFAADAEVECFPDPGGQLQAQPVGRRLIRSGKKIRQLYQDRAFDIAQAWAHVRGTCQEAERFSTEFAAAVPELEG
jgi:hypothetical protein